MTGVVGLVAGLLISELWRGGEGGSKEVTWVDGGSEVNHAGGRRSSGAMRESRRTRHRAKSLNGVSAERMGRLANFERSVLMFDYDGYAAYASMSRELIEWTDQAVMDAFFKQEIFDEDNPIDMAVFAEACRRNPQDVAAIFMQKGLRDSYEAMNLLVGAWGEIDPLAACQWAIASIGDADSEAMLVTLIKSYAVDPKATQGIIQGAEGKGVEFDDESLAGIMILGLKTQNPDIDLNMALKDSGLSVDPELMDQMVMMADVLLDPSALFEKVQQGEDVSLPLSILLETGSLSENPEQSIELIMQLSDQQSDSGFHDTSDLLASIAQRSPRAVLKAVKERGIPLDGNLLENVSETLARTQSFESHLAWVKNLDSSEQRNEAANAAWDSLSESQVTQLKHAGIQGPELPEVPNE